MWIAAWITTEDTVFTLDKNRMVRYFDIIFRLTRYSGSATYLAVAAMKLLGAIDRLYDRERTIEWCVKRQQFGMQV